MKNYFSLIPLLIATTLAHPGHNDPHSQDEKQTPVVVAVVYSDFQCGPCSEVGGLIQRIITEKKQPIRTLFKHSPSHPDSLVLHEASLAAAQQGKFWEMHDFIFANPKANFSTLLKQAGNLGMDVKRFEAALDERTFRSRVISDITESKGMGVSKTPTLFINGTKLEGIDKIRSFVDQVLAPPPSPVDPNKIHEFNLAGSPTTGPANAPITLVEFSDFRCGFCSAHSRNVTALCEAFPGKIRRVFKHFPLQMTTESRLPHLGAMAAMKQGKFWPMYHALMKVPLKDRTDLMNRAGEIGLDLPRFEKDLTARDVTSLVDRDITEGDGYLIRMTPTTFVNGKVLSGRHSLDSLTKHIEAILKTGAKKSDHDLSLEPTTRGSDLAGTVIEFFGDLNDDKSRRVYSAIKEFHRNDEHNIRIEFHHYPTLNDEQSLMLHRAIMAAGKQGKLWELADLVSAVTTPLSEATLKSYAVALRMDGDRFAKDFSDPLLLSTLKKMVARGAEREFKGSPAIFLNGFLVPGFPGVKELQEAQKKSTDCCGKDQRS